MQNIFTTRSMLGAYVYEIIEPAPGVFYACWLTFLPNKPFTPAEQAQFDADQAESAAMEAYFGLDHVQPPDCYTTPAAAQRAMELHDEIHAACDEIDAFGAGGMGFERSACCPYKRELEELEASFGWHPTPRQPTIIEQYPFLNSGNADEFFAHHV